MVRSRNRPRLTMYARERIRQMLSEGSTCREVATALSQEGIHTCRQTVWRLERHIKAHGSVLPLPKSGRPTKLTNTALKKIDDAMSQDDETTAKELVAALQGAGVSVSKSTALKGRRLLGWTSRGAAYCQLIRVPNREKRLRWAQEYLGKDFDDVIWTDETSIQMETHRRFCCRKRGQKPRYKPRPKHPPKVHVWAGISWNGATKACIFEGIMNADLYCGILDGHLVRFIRTVYPHSHRFMQDNDPKHTSRRAAAFFAVRGINWWKTAPESPDANPIENLWQELKVCTYVCACVYSDMCLNVFVRTHSIYIYIYICTCTHVCMYIWSNSDFLQNFCSCP